MGSEFVCTAQHEVGRGMDKFGPNKGFAAVASKSIVGFNSQHPWQVFCARPESGNHEAYGTESRNSQSAHHYGIRGDLPNPPAGACRVAPSRSKGTGETC